MYSSNFILKGDSGIIGNELFPTSINEFQRKISMIQRTVKDGDFTLGEALEAYGVAQLEYQEYLLNSLLSEFKGATDDLESPKTRLLFSIEVIMYLYKNLESIDRESPKILAHLSELRHNLESEKIAS